MNMGIQISVQVPAFIYLGYIPRKIANLYINSVQFSEEPLYGFPQWLHHFTQPPVMHNSSKFCNPHQHLLCSVSFAFVSFYFFLIYNSKSNGCKAVSHFAFVWHFPDDQYADNFFHVPIYFLNIFFQEMSITVFGLFLESQMQKTNLCLPRWERRGRVNQEVWIDIYTLPYIKQITNKDLLYSTGTFTQYTVMTYMGK